LLVSLLGEVIVILLTLQGKPDDITPRTVSVFWGKGIKEQRPCSQQVLLLNHHPRQVMEHENRTPQAMYTDNPYSYNPYPSLLHSTPI